MHLTYRLRGELRSRGYLGFLQTLRFDMSTAYLKTNSSKCETHASKAVYNTFVEPWASDTPLVNSDYMEWLLRFPNEEWVSKRDGASDSGWSRGSSHLSIGRSDTAQIGLRGWHLSKGGGCSYSTHTKKNILYSSLKLWRSYSTLKPGRTNTVITRLISMLQNCLFLYEG